MAIPKKITNFLEKNKVKYEEIFHRTAYTAFDKAQTLKVKPNIVGKTLILKTDKEQVICLIGANRDLDKNKFQKVINNWRKKNIQKSIKKIRFLSERIMKNKFKGVKIGAVPPFGNLFGVRTFVDNSLLKQKKIIIAGGNYNTSIRMSGMAFKKLIPDLIKGIFTKKKK